MASFKEWKRDFNKLTKWQKVGIVLAIISLIGVGGSLVFNNLMINTGNNNTNTQISAHDVNQFINNKNSLTISATNIADTSFCNGDNCQSEYTKNIYPQYPSNFFTITLLLVPKTIRDLNMLQISPKNILLIKNDIKKKVFIENPFESDKNIAYGMCNESATECEIFDKFIYDETTMRDTVCMITSRDLNDNCLLMINQNFIPQSSCPYPIPPNFEGFPLRFNLKQNETFEEYTQRCTIK